MTRPAGDITGLLVQLREGNGEALNALVPLIYNDLRRLASACLRGERAGHTLQSTALVHEAYLRLASAEPEGYQNRGHFFAIAANTMRKILVDHARRRQAGKRGGPQSHKVDFDAELLMEESSLHDVLAIDEALERLARIDLRQSAIVELRYFGGLSVEESAEVMQLSEITIKREWRSAKAWLHRELATAKSP
jgi:RNA polymerase sigma factor (TIGR02999 family)